MPKSAAASSFGMSFHWGTRQLLNVSYFTPAGIRRKQEDSQSVVEITVNYVMFDGYLKKNKPPHTL